MPEPALQTVATHSDAAIVSDESVSVTSSLNAWLCLVVWLAFALPMFIRMPLTNDTCLFDIQARMVTQGGTLYRDMHEPNLPGVVWLQMLARAVGGESSETMRAFDLIVFTGILAMMFRVLHRWGSVSSRQTVWTITGLSVFYLSLSEWCHCQRDTWVLLPVLAGAILRMCQIDRAQRRQSNSASHVAADPTSVIVDRVNHRSFATWSALEGLVWAVGIWIKPHILISIVAVWFIGWRAMPNRRAALLDSFGLLAGGLLGGAIGIGWLKYCGAWPYFIDTLSNWNPDYLAAGRENWTASRFNAMFIRFFPWLLVHLVAISIAGVAIFRSTCRAKAIEPARRMNLAEAVLAAVYLTWLFHSFFLQHLFDYVHVPAVMLGVALVALHGAASPNTNRYRLVAVVFACLVVSFNPMLRKERLALWQLSFSADDSVELQDRLAHFDNPYRADLYRVEEFLKSQNVKQHDVCCYNSDCVSIYWHLNLLPATRFTYLFELMNYHPSRAADFQAALESHPHRFIVTDLVSSGLPIADAIAVDPRNPLLPPKYPRAKNTYPWSHPVVFRAGTYLVHEVQQPIGTLRMPRRQAK